MPGYAGQPPGTSCSVHGLCLQVCNGRNGLFSMEIDFQISAYCPVRWISGLLCLLSNVSTCEDTAGENSKQFCFEMSLSQRTWFDIESLPRNWLPGDPSLFTRLLGFKWLASRCHGVLPAPRLLWSERVTASSKCLQPLVRKTRD